MGIRSIGYVDGILDIVGVSLESDYVITSTYYFEEKQYEFTDIDFNPINNLDILQQRVFLFIDPETALETKAQTLYYGIVDKKGQVIESNWSSFDNTTQTLSTGETLYYEAVPSFITPGSYSIFVDDYSVEGSGVFLILGDISVEANSSVDDANIFDVRIRGGGIREDRLAAAKEKNAEVCWYWDVGHWDGVPYPETATYFVEVPAEIFSGAGGTLTQKRAKELIDKHTAFGVYPIVKAYGIDPIMTSVIPYTTSIYLSWSSYGSDVSYNVYYSLDGDYWVKSNGSVLPDAAGGNTYTITGLETNVLYYVAVVGGKTINGTWRELSGQSVGPFDIGIKEVDNPNIVIARTFEAGA
jgi:hypothetical protein